MQPQIWCTALGVDTSYPILPCSFVSMASQFNRTNLQITSFRNTSEHRYTSAINAWSMYACMHVYIYLHAMRALPLCVCLLEGVHTYVCDPEKAGEGNKFHMHIATDSKIFWQSFSIILSRGALLWRVWLHGAEGEGVEHCSVWWNCGVFARCLQGLSWKQAIWKLPPLCKMLNKQRHG